MKADLYLHDGLVVTEDGAFHGGVTVKDGKIAQILHGDLAVEAEETIELGGKALLPGLVDDHAHFNEPGRTEWEGFLTGSMSAAAGGVTTPLEMPLNATPPTIDRAQLLRKHELASTQCVVDYAFWGGLVHDNLKEIDALHAEGVIGFKSFMSDAGTDFPRVDDDLLYAGLRKVKQLGNIIGLHAENDSIVSYAARQLREAGRVDRDAWLESRPPEGELEAIRRALYWAAAADARLHIVHISIADGVRAIAEARRSGTRATAETCPHYLCLDRDAFVRLGPVAKCAPPIRPRAEVEQLWKCLLDGMVDTVASDHSPCPVADKERGNDNIWEAWGGVTGIQTMLPAILTEGVHKRGLTLPHLVRLMSANPARIFGVYPKKGALLPGSDADMVIVDLDEEWTLSADQMFSKHKHCPYVGMHFKGQVERTIVRGTTVYQDGEILVKPGFGKLVRRLAA